MNLNKFNSITFKRSIRKFIINNFALDYKFKTYKDIVSFPRASFILMNLLLIMMIRVDLQINLLFIPTILFIIGVLFSIYLSIYSITDKDISLLDESQKQQYTTYKIRNNLKVKENIIIVEKNNYKLYFQIFMFLGTLAYFLIKYL